MRVLIIPDVHLKAWMFDDADRILSNGGADRAVVLGDLVDEWGCEANGLLYGETLSRALTFQQAHPDTLWCYGNHDMAYLWNVPCSGNSRYYNVREAAVIGLRALYDAVPEGNAAYIHRIENVLFSHAGVSRMYVRDHRGSIGYDNEQAVIDQINTLHRGDMWYDDSPLWLRPQKCYAGYRLEMYRPRRLLQVVGHSPMQEITQEGNLLSCDTFSTRSTGEPYGNQTFCILDTETWRWESVLSTHAEQT